MTGAFQAGRSRASRWLVTGAGGMLAKDLCETLAAAGVPAGHVTALDRRALDVTDPDAVRAAVEGHDVVVNCAAWTAVDDAETQEAQAFAVNALGPQHLAAACAATGAWLVQISTDYVFGGGGAVDRADGRADGKTGDRADDGAAGPGRAPHAERQLLSPASAYGRTKAAGEWAVRALLPERSWIVRIAWLYGRHGPNFVRTMARLEGERETVDVVDDQIGQPTWTVDVAGRVVDLAERAVPAGTYHATSTGSTSWFGLAREVFDLLGADPDRVRPMPSSALTRPAPRPAWSVLGHDAWTAEGLPALPHWRESLHRAVATTDLLARRSG